MKQNLRWVLWMAAGAVSFGLTPGLAPGQYQTQDSTGRLLDANNRLGSNGVNDARRDVGGASADDIVYGNVTGGKQFRGNLRSTDARAFRGTISQPSDNLVRSSGQSAYQQTEAYDPYKAQKYYGDRRGVNAPPDFSRLQVGSPGTFEVAKPTYRVPGDLRMDATIPNPELGMTQPTTYMLPGLNASNPNSVDLAAAVSLPNAQLQQQADEQQLLMPARDLLRRLNLSDEQLRQMREEYRRTGEQQSPDQKTQDQQKQQKPEDVTLAPETPINDPLNSRVTNDVQSQTLNGSLDTEQSLRQRLVTASPLASRQNTQYAELQKRLDRFRQTRNMTDEEANRQFMDEWNASQKQQQEANQAKPQQPTTPEQPAVTQAPQERTAKSADDETAGETRARFAIRQQPQESVQGILPPQPDLPVRIASFADGVKATGLKNLLTDAEKAMHDGKFTQALDYYDAAAAVAPDNSMVLMGRAIAELGAGYYARAQVHIEQVLEADPALLMARYDLKAFYGDERLQYIVRDLKDLSQSETRQSRPLFLLAFIAYSTENEQRTADYLKLAEQRGGSKAFYDELREYWRLNPKPANKVPGVAPKSAAPQTPAGQPAKPQ